VLQAPDVKTAQAAAAAAEADAKAQADGKLTIADISGIGDKAVWAHGGGGNPLGVAGMYVLSGANFFDITNIVIGKDAQSESGLRDPGRDGPRPVAGPVIRPAACLRR
jgi:hypothetical protein